MLTDAGAGRRAGAGRDAGQVQGRSATPITSSPAARARCPQDSRGLPWTGEYVFSSGDLVEDLTHNYFLETGARNGKLKVYQMVDHPAARALTGYLLVRGGVHQVAYARALEKLTGVDMMKAFPAPRIETAKIPECQPHIKKDLHRILYRFSHDRLQRDRGGLQRPASGDRRGPDRRRTARRRARCRTTCRRRTDVFAPGLRARGHRRDRAAAAQGRGPARQADRGRGRGPATATAWPTRSRTWCRTPGTRRS